MIHLQQTVCQFNLDPGICFSFEHRLRMVGYCSKSMSTLHWMSILFIVDVNSNNSQSQNPPTYFLFCIFESVKMGIFSPVLYRRFYYCLILAHMCAPVYGIVQVEVLSTIPNNLPIGVALPVVGAAVEVAVDDVNAQYVGLLNVSVTFLYNDADRICDDTDANAPILLAKHYYKSSAAGRCTAVLVAGETHKTTFNIADVYRPPLLFTHCMRVLFCVFLIIRFLGCGGIALAPFLAKGEYSIKLKNYPCISSKYQMWNSTWLA